MKNYHVNDETIFINLEDEVKGEHKLKMNKEGYQFVTNFFTNQENCYKEAAEIHGLNYRIEEICYSFHGNDISSPNLRAFYVSFQTKQPVEFLDTLISLIEKKI